MQTNAPVQSFMNPFRRASSRESLLIAAEPRSGSSWLLETLNRQGSIVLCDELLNPRSAEARLSPGDPLPANTSEWLDYVEKNLTAGVRYTGFKMLFPQLEKAGPGFVEQFIARRPNTRVILLRRENAVMCLLSLSIAHASKSWHIHRRDGVRKHRILVNPGVFIQNLDALLQLREKSMALFRSLGVPLCSLTYAGLFNHQRQTLRELMDFLGLRPLWIKTSREVKGNPFRPSEIIENYVQLESGLRSYPVYHGMLMEGETTDLFC